MWIEEKDGQHTMSTMTTKTRLTFCGGGAQWRLVVEDGPIRQSDEEAGAGEIVIRAQAHGLGDKANK
nr:hypothetical protein CFP56_33711 [Quercus suber]